MEAEMNPYEQQREDRIKRNKEVLIQMGILTAVSALDELLKRRQGVAARTGSSRLRGEAAAVVQCDESQKTYRHVSWTLPASIMAAVCPLL